MKSVLFPFIPISWHSYLVVGCPDWSTWHNCEWLEKQDWRMVYWFLIINLLISPHSIGSLYSLCCKSLTRLTDLVLRDNFQISDYCVSKLTNLKSLDISYNTHVSDKGLVTLTGLTKLKLEKTWKVTANCLKFLPNLESISLLSNPNINLGHCANIESLKHIHL
jgi:hypothetical protein